MNFLRQISTQSQRFGRRVFNRHLRIGVTGLSGAGKTAFITSLINQLTAADAKVALPFFEVMQQQRYLGGRLSPQTDLNSPRFPYEQNLLQLQQQQWPQSTTGWSQLNLTLRYQSKQLFSAKWAEYNELELEIIDYPGEWLLDLPMLRQDYQQWSTFCWQQFESEPRQALSAEFRQQLAALGDTELTEGELQQFSRNYAQLLTKMKQQQALLLQPGRLLLPGELAETALLWLFPLLPEQLAADTPLAKQLARQFRQYQQKVIEPFYQDYFASIDRQVVLVDCLSALNHGYAAMQEMQQALMLVLQSFQYGSDSWLRRLIKPRIHKVLFAASKADLLTPGQHRNLILLLQQLLQQPLQDSRYQHCQSEAMALSAVVSSQTGKVTTAAGSRDCIQGIDQHTGERVTMFPGDVPISMPSALLFAHHAFAFPAFLPQVTAEQTVLPQQRLDQALQFLLGDKLT